MSRNSKIEAAGLMLRQMPQNLINFTIQNEC